MERGHPDLTRRSFSIGLMAASFSTACGPKQTPPTAAPEDPAPSSGNGPPTLLILGGTGFLGPHVVEAAQAAGYRVTLFNRGKTNPHLFPDLEKLRGDRNDDLSELEGREFDVVVDTSGYFPRQVEASAGLLADHCERYLFVSSVSAYAELNKPGLVESAKTVPMPEPYSEQMPDNYGALKAGCERAAEAAMPGRVLIIRPGLIVGPGDPTDRFTYWPVRMARGGKVLAPNDPSDPVQYIDARDLAAFMVKGLGDGRNGIYNAVGPGEQTSIGALIETCSEVAGVQSELVWAPTPFLTENEVAPWMHLTVWVPTDDPEFGGMTRVSGAKAIAAGLTFRPTEEIVADTLTWWNEQPEERRSQPRAGLPATREAEVLAKLAEQSAKSAA